MLYVSRSNSSPDNYYLPKLERCFGSGWQNLGRVRNGPAGNGHCINLAKSIKYESSAAANAPAEIIVTTSANSNQSQAPFPGYRQRRSPFCRDRAMASANVLDDDNYFRACTVLDHTAYHGPGRVIVSRNRPGICPSGLGADFKCILEPALPGPHWHRVSDFPALGSVALPGCTPRQLSCLAWSCSGIRVFLARHGRCHLATRWPVCECTPTSQMGVVEHWLRRLSLGFAGLERDWASHARSGSQRLRLFSGWYTGAPQRAAERLAMVSLAGDLPGIRLSLQDHLVPARMVCASAGCGR